MFYRRFGPSTPALLLKRFVLLRLSCPRFFDRLIRLGSLTGRHSCPRLMGQLQGLGSLAGWSASVIWPVCPDSLSLPRYAGRYTSAKWPVSCPRFFDRLIRLGSLTCRHSCPRLMVWPDSLPRCYCRCLPRLFGRLFVLGSVAAAYFGTLAGVLPALAGTRPSGSLAGRSVSALCPAAGIMLSVL